MVLEPGSCPLSSAPLLVHEQVFRSIYEGTKSAEVMLQIHFPCTVDRAENSGSQFISAVKLTFGSRPGVQVDIDELLATEHVQRQEDRILHSSGLQACPIVLVSVFYKSVRQISATIVPA